MFIYTLGFISALAIYHLLIFLGRRTDYSNLSYSIFCISFASALYIRETFALDNLIINSIFIVTVHFVAGSIAIFAIYIFKIKRLLYQKIINVSWYLLSFHLIITIVIAFILNNYSILFSLYLPVVSLFGVLCLISLTYTYLKDKLYLDKIKLSVAIGFSSVVLMCIISAILHSLNILPPFVEVASVFLINCIIFANALSVYLNREHKELHMLNEKLEEKVKERTQQLNKANNEKTAFFINLAHETKTPLTLIKNYLDEYAKTQKPDQRLKIIKNNINKLTRDITNFLDSKRIEHSSLLFHDFKNINISNILKEKIILFQTIANKNRININVNIQDNIVLYCDPLALDRIIDNLLSNAIKYNRNGGSISITLYPANNNIVLTIKDTGIGISEEHQKYIFDQYYQISKPKKNIEGMGIGLYIVKNIITSLNGSITLESEKNIGSTFKVVLPNNLEGEPSFADERKQLFQPIDTINKIRIKVKHIKNRPAILLVEDNIDLLNFIAKSLEKSYNIYTAVNGEEAINLLTITEIDLIISDIMMDKMDGYEFRETVIKMDKLKTIPFIFLTAKTGINERIRGLSQGAVDYICKPFEILELKEKIKNWLLLIELKGSKEGINLKLKHQSRLENFIKENDISPKEKEVLNYLLKGYKNIKIADKMFISNNTVRKHIERIKEKLNIVKKDELIKYLFDYVYK